VDALLLDAYHPQQLGGTGLTLDWRSLQTFSPPCPWLLAGGLRPDNLRPALATLSPQGIDLSSGVEVRPGVKDLALVRQLFEQIELSRSKPTCR
jgi:phosphoribosylanthranilate isomerase